ncbi:predicted protein [Chaetoceros tenuissimus]|uniref:Uncharacterized protein n=1 Tax=Chaetoceros tenuissimus TaxID=426638 RepID=A0AAD3CLE4_9STRA|nr:predicted protein [Chaetoceros tenuissimus]
MSIIGKLYIVCILSLSLGNVWASLGLRGSTSICPFSDEQLLRSAIRRANTGQLVLEESSCIQENSRISISYCDSYIQRDGMLRCIGYHEWTALQIEKTQALAAIEHRQSWNSFFGTLTEEEFSACWDIINKECAKLDRSRIEATA